MSMLLCFFKQSFSCNESYIWCLIVQKTKIFIYEKRFTEVEKKQLDLLTLFMLYKIVKLSRPCTVSCAL